VYGHPDHVKVHQVGQRAAELAGTPRVLEATANRDHMVRMMAMAPDTGGEEFDPEGPADDGNPFGSREDELTHSVDVSPWLERKRAALACHGSQVPESSFFLQMPLDVFATAFGTEWFIEPGVPSGLPLRSWLFE
jgi:LmbE family N-acetylglucosaminyl deacetylase